MIINLEEFKKSTNKTLILCKCDYCNIEFTRMKKYILEGIKITNKHACSNVKCKNKKIEDSYMVKFGVKNVRQNSEIKTKAEQTNLKKYGVKNPMQNPEIKAKAEQTNFELYGAKNPFQSEEIKLKIENINLKKYGVKNPMQNPEIKEKVYQSNLEKFGVKYVTQNKEIYNKIIQTNLQKYGVPYNLQSPEIREKIKQTNITKYGFSCCLQNTEVKTKSKQTSLKKYGVDNYAKTKEHKLRVKLTCLEKYGVDNYAKTKECKLKIKQICLDKYGQFPVNNYGKTQKGIENWLNSFRFNFSPNHIILNGKEIDIYDDNLKLGIEYCGLYWHHELSSDTEDMIIYHYNKYKNCLNNNVKLITLFEDEWLNRQNQIKIYLKQLLNINLNKISINDCKIQQISEDELNNFLELYSIEGKTESIISFGIFYNNELIGVINLKLQENILLLNRICFKEDIFIESGRKELFHKCVEFAKINNYKEIYCITDNRWITSNMEPENLGFEFLYEGKPDYTYVNIIKGKERLIDFSDKLMNCPTDKLEEEYMLDLGYSRIWDCGEKLWIYDIFANIT